MNIALWILQVILGAAFVTHAYLMLRPDEAQLRERGMTYILGIPAGLRAFTATAEGIGGLALVLPPLLHVVTWFTPVAALGLVTVMLGAIVLHVRRREYPNLALNGFLLLLAAVVAWGRLGPYRF